jgi:hypothetical protein
VPRSYRFIDAAPPNGADRVLYRLKQVDRDGSFEYSPDAVLSAETSASDLQVFPNPGSGAGTVRYMLETSAEVSLDLYSLDGKRVRHVFGPVSADAGAHAHSIDYSGVPAGSYYLMLSAGLQQRTLRVTVR